MVIAVILVAVLESAVLVDGQTEATTPAEVGDDQVCGTKGQKGEPGVCVRRS